VGQKEAELVSLRSSSAERLAAIEEERATTATRLAEVQCQVKDVQTASNAFAREVARKQAGLEVWVVELTTVASGFARALEAARVQIDSLQDKLGVAIAERRQLLGVATDCDRELTSKSALRCGPFRIGHLYLLAGMLTHDCCCCIYLRGAAHAAGSAGGLHRRDE
jgi:hypothetical protein